ncbi:MAG TPA: DNA-3-methyladenine glycosylase I [Candidatus Lustribacter sp.]|nr:DNA-3-methyladenine glycosylase I [Candidatus Lustribacter sp.]
MTAKAKPLVRCPWATSSPLEQAYHDDEWGIPEHGENALFECISLEGAQAGLSWDTVLRKRENYRKAFAGFDLARVARFTPARIDKLVLDPGLIRHRGKLESVVSNAKAILAIAKEFGSFDAYVWGFARTEAPKLRAEALSKDMRKRGLRFVGPTIVYAFMQAVGIVNDHIATCAFRDPARARRKGA